MTPHVNTVAETIRKIYSLKEEILKVVLDDNDTTKIVRVGAYLSHEMRHKIVSFLKDNVSTFAWSTSDMKGIDPNITTHALNVDPTFKSVRQKICKLVPEQSKTVNEEVERFLSA